MQKLEIMQFWAWLRASGMNLILDESKLQAQSLKVKTQAFQAFEQLVHLCIFAHNTTVFAKNITLFAKNTSV